MNLDDFSTVVDDRRYINPQVGLDESNAFIENLRETQKGNTQEIAEDTYNLGTAVPSNLGGLGGAGSYFTSRYQTPQTNDVVANLRSTAQAQALSEALSNKVAQAKERYNQAYRSAQKRARSYGGGGGGYYPSNPNNPDGGNGLQFKIGNLIGDVGGIMVNQNKNTGIGRMNTDSRGRQYYQAYGRKYYLTNLTPGERLTWDQLEKAPANGTIRSQNGKQYMYVTGPQGSNWYRITGTDDLERRLSGAQ